MLLRGIYYWNVDLGSLKCATIRVRGVLTKARQTLTIKSTRKNGGKIPNDPFILSRPGVEPARDALARLPVLQVITTELRVSSLSLQALAYVLLTSNVIIVNHRHFCGSVMFKRLSLFRWLSFVPNICQPDIRGH